jgi:hypothetical protein
VKEKNLIKSSVFFPIFNKIPLFLTLFIYYKISSQKKTNNQKLCSQRASARFKHVNVWLGFYFFIENITLKFFINRLYYYYYYLYDLFFIVHNQSMYESNKELKRAVRTRKREKKNEQENNYIKLPIRKRRKFQLK